MNDLFISEKNISLQKKSTTQVNVQCTLEIQLVQCLNLMTLIEGLLSFLILTSSVINVKAESNVNSWSFTNGAWYHFDEQGNAQTGLQEIDGNLYYLDGNGAMKTG